MGRKNLSQYVSSLKNVGKRSKDTFYFKYFSVCHRESAHKVGTDGVLLGAWVHASHASRILDIGTGTGVVALMLAQRTSNEAVIDAIDISSEECKQAIENFHRSPWSKKISVHPVSLQHFHSDPYDLIVSNPPFFINSAKPPKEGRIRARHTETLSIQELVTHAKRLLNPNGRLCIILPPTEGELCISVAKNQQLFCTKKCKFYSRENKPIERVLLEFQFHDIKCAEENLTLYLKDEIWTEQYKELTKDFYLKY